MGLGGPTTEMTERPFASAQNARANQLGGSSAPGLVRGLILKYWMLLWFNTALKLHLFGHRASVIDLEGGRPDYM
jgi:hypothetical protein